jgi:hypothetical protein
VQVGFQVFGCIVEAHPNSIDTYSAGEVMNTPESKSISIDCGDLQSNAIAAAVEAGQAPGRHEDHEWRSVPFGDLQIGTNSNRAGAVVILSAECNPTSITPTGRSQEVILKSKALVDLPTDDGADRHGWARWAPSWKAKISLPDNEFHSHYSVKIVCSDKNTNGTPLPDGVVRFADEESALPSNGYGDISVGLGPGEYLLTLGCDRGEGFTFDEMIIINIAVERTEH